MERSAAGERGLRPWRERSSSGDLPVRHAARHDLVWLTPAAWQRLHDGCGPDDADLLGHWAGCGLPLVVTRRPPEWADDKLALGLPAPRRWSGRRLALAVRHEEVERCGRFPTLPEAIDGLPANVARRLTDVAGVLGDGAASVRVYGSHGWQVLTQLDCLREGSDLDLLLDAPEERSALELCSRLLAYAGTLRLDGELLLPQGRAVSWREWHGARGRLSRVLVKRQDGVELMSTDLLWSTAEVEAA